MQLTSYGHSNGPEAARGKFLNFEDALKLDISEEARRLWIPIDKNSR